MLAEYLLKERLARHPGGRYSYSNTGYEILTAIIEEQTGRPYEDYCREAVFGKLGYRRAEAASRLADARGRWRLVHPRAGLSCFPRHLRSGPSVPWRYVKAWIDQAQTKWTPTNRDRWYSLGVNTWAGAGRWAVSHGGILHSRGKNARRRTDRGIQSSATRSGRPTAPRCSSRWIGRPRRETRWRNCGSVIGETHKLVKTLP